MKQSDGGSAFPTLLTGKYAGVGAAGQTFAPDMSDGMSLRDWFAGMALQGILSRMKPHDAKDEQSVTGRIANLSYVIADAMLTERE